MKRVALLGLILLVALLALSCVPEISLEIPVEETQEGIVITNIGSVDVIVFVTWPDREERFDIAVGQTKTAEGMPSNISAVRK